ncbi:hypothetical protein D8676_15425 [Mesorhizobium sp. YM1C-6-2]|nr:hypothetical protein D8676_15425 [Mesorhizobium sp. YM1C-6-2]
MRASPLDEHRKTLSAQTTFHRALSSADFKACPIGFVQGSVKNGFEAAGVVDLARRRPVGHLPGRNQVAAPQLDAVNTDLCCCFVHQALDEENRLRTTGTAIRRSRLRMREQTLCLDIHARDIVDIRNHFAA